MLGAITATRIDVRNHAIQRFRSRFLDRLPEGATDEDIAEHLRAICRNGLQFGAEDVGRGMYRIKRDGVPMIIRPHPNGAVAIITILPTMKLRTGSKDTKRNAKRMHVLKASHDRKRQIEEMDADDRW